MIKATILLDSLNEFGNRLTTPILEIPRIVLAELNTHKMISKNSASSRAIPFAKMLERVQNDPFIPIKWMKNHSGMQGTEYIEPNTNESIACQAEWLEGRDRAIKTALQLSEFGVTKQIVNRLLEPFMWHKVLASATEWSNFLALRAADGAEIHIQDLAYKLLEAMNNSIPKLLKPGEWHIPFNNSLNIAELSRLWDNGTGEKGLPTKEFIENITLKISSARCARTSYNNFDGTSDYSKDIELHDKLVEGGHWSPLEHLARAMTEQEFFTYSRTIIIPTSGIDEYEANNNSDWFEIIGYIGGYNQDTIVTEFGWCKNYRGWIPYRHLFNNENRREPRLLKK